MHDSVRQMWRAYLGESDRPISSFYFGDNQADADELADLVKRGIKRATSTSLWFFEASGQPLPKPGDPHVVTDWAGVAHCMIRTTRVDIVPFDQVTEEYAAVEGEGDGSLEYWKRVHWAYYHRELAGTGYSPTPDMPIVCERFEVVFPGG